MIAVAIVATALSVGPLGAVGAQNGTNGTDVDTSTNGTNASGVDNETIENVTENVTFGQFDTVAAAQENVSFEVGAPTELPEGYDLSNASVIKNTGGPQNNTTVVLTYTNGSRLSSSLTVTLSSPARQSGGVQQFPTSENVSFDGQSGVFASVNEQGLLTFNRGDVTHVVAGPFGQETLVNVAASIGDDTTTTAEETDTAEDATATEESDDGSEGKAKSDDTTTEATEETENTGGKVKQPSDGGDGAADGGNGKAKND